MILRKPYCAIDEKNAATLQVRLILLDCADYLIYYTRKEVTYELLTHEYNYWRWAYESILLP